MRPVEDQDGMVPRVPWKNGAPKFSEDHERFYRVRLNSMVAMVIMIAAAMVR
jgi:hypothetical protein